MGEGLSKIQILLLFKITMKGSFSTFKNILIQDLWKMFIFFKFKQGKKLTGGEYIECFGDQNLIVTQRLGKKEHFAKISIDY